MRRSLLLTLSAVLSIFISGTAFASTPTPTPVNGANGYNVFPLLNSVDVPAGSSKTVTIYVDNASHAVEQVQTIVNDFMAAPSDNGSAALLLNGGTSKFSLKQFISIPNDNFILTPGQTEGVGVVIKIPAHTNSGGYFGAIRFAPASAVNSKKNVNISASIASLILVTVPGNLKQNLGITKLGVGSNATGQTHKLFTSNKNLYGVVYLQNYGNVQVQPYGNLIVRSGKHDLDTESINKTSGYILPDSTRYFTNRLHNVGSFGKYTLYASLGYGTNGQLLYDTSTFYVVPVWALYAFPILVVVLIILLALLISRIGKNKSKSQYRAQ